MFDKVARTLTVGAAFGSLLLGAQGASAAVTYTFDTTAAPVSYSTTSNGYTAINGFYASATYTSGALNMRVTGWQASTDGKTVVQSSLGLYNIGIGVQSSNDTGNFYTGAIYDHQIDNKNGVDFVMLQFNQAVSLTGLGRYAYAMASYPNYYYTYNSDAAYWADTTGAIGASPNVNLVSAMTATAANSYKVQSNWTPLAGTSSSSNQDTTTLFSSNKVSNVWLVGADYLNQGSDGFKLSSVTVASVPEPASWAMMIVGFGAVGGAMRRTRREGALKIA